jgi:curved DNA-binding protein CbpA
MNPEKDYYGLMGLSQSADVNVINAVFRVLAKKYHPDTHGGSKNEAERLFRELKEAHDVLSDPSKRSEYDKARNSSSSSTSDFDPSAHKSDQGDQSYSDPELEKDWKIATQIYPSLDDLRRDLSGLSATLAIAFTSVLLETKGFERATKLHEQMKFDFLSKFFGSNSETTHVAEQLLRNGHREAALELNHTIRVVGIPTNVTATLQKVLNKHNLVISYGEVFGKLDAAKKDKASKERQELIEIRDAQLAKYIGTTFLIFLGVIIFVVLIF